MQKDQSTERDAPRPEFSVSFRTVPTYTSHVSIKARHSRLLSRIIHPFGRLV